jgi:hypothetical protein
MKTFLHYTKERELDEGILSGLAGLAGVATRGLAKVGAAAEVSRSVAAGFERGAKPGSGLKAITGAAGAAVNRAEKATKEKSGLAAEKADCVRRLDYYQQLLNNAAGNAQKEKNIRATIDRIKNECAATMKAVSIDRLAKEREAEDKAIIDRFDTSVSGKKGFDKYG